MREEDVTVVEHRETQDGATYVVFDAQRSSGGAASLSLARELAKRLQARPVRRGDDALRDVDLRYGLKLISSDGDDARDVEPAVSFWSAIVRLASEVRSAASRSGPAVPLAALAAAIGLLCACCCCFCCLPRRHKHSKVRQDDDYDDDDDMLEETAAEEATPASLRRPLAPLEAVFSRAATEANDEWVDEAYARRRVGCNQHAPSASVCDGRLVDGLDMPTFQI